MDERTRPTTVDTDQVPDVVETTPHELTFDHLVELVADLTPAERQAVTAGADRLAKARQASDDMAAAAADAGPSDPPPVSAVADPRLIADR